MRRGSIERLAVLVHRPGIGREERTLLRSEIALWREIYLGTEALNQQEVDRWAVRVRDLDLGWYEYLALADLYRRTGLTELAEEQVNRASVAAARSARLLLGLLAFLVALGGVGVVILIWYVSRRSRAGDVNAAERGIPAHAKEVRSGYLLEVFVVYMAVLIGAQIVAGLLMVIGRPVEGVSISTMDTIVVTAMHALAGIAALIYLARRLRAAGWSWDAVGLTSRRPLQDALWGVGAYAAALPLILAAGLLSQFVGRHVQSPTNPVIPMFFETDALLGRSLLFVLVAFAAPFFEEVFFRGVLFHSFRARWGIVWGVVVSSIVFAAVHPIPVGFLQIFVLGSVFSITLHERRSVLSPMIAHGLNNTVAFVLLSVMMG
jgi:uncharacterized protein